jgi:hypothetical protein
MADQKSTTETGASNDGATTTDQTATAPATAEKAPVVGAADAPVAVATVDTSKAGRKASDAKGTTLDSDVTKPATTKPGDGPADTTNPNEVASTVIGQPSDEAIAAGTVNAVRKVGEIVPAKVESGRTEQYDVRGPDGKLVTVKRNIDTGATERVAN